MAVRFIWISWGRREEAASERTGRENMFFFLFKPQQQRVCAYLRRLGVFLVQPVVLFALLLVLIVVFLQLLPHSINIVLLHQLVLTDRGGEMKLETERCAETQDRTEKRLRVAVRCERMKSI